MNQHVPASRFLSPPPSSSSYVVRTPELNNGYLPTALRSLNISWIAEQCQRLISLHADAMLDPIYKVLFPDSSKVAQFFDTLDVTIAPSLSDIF